MSYLAANLTVQSLTEWKIVEHILACFLILLILYSILAEGLLQEDRPESGRRIHGLPEFIEKVVGGEP